MGITVLLADDHQIVREGLKSLISGQLGIEVVGEAADGAEAVRLATKLAPNVVVIDISMPVLNGIDATMRILEIRPMTRVIVLSMHQDRRYVRRALQAGARAYLIKESAFGELADAIRAVVSGRTFLSPRIAGTVVEDYLSRISGLEGGGLEVLTAKEREVLQLLAEGVATKQVAARLGVSVKTAETHRQNIMHKLGLKNIVELTRFAIREGVTDLDR